jgi:hypothetical protein
MNKILTIITAAAAISLSMAGIVEAKDRNGRYNNQRNGNEVVVVNPDRVMIDRDRRGGNGRQEAYRNDRRYYSNERNDRRYYGSDRRYNNGRHYFAPRKFFRAKQRKKMRKIRRLRRWAANNRMDRPVIIITNDRRYR